MVATMRVSQGTRAVPSRRVSRTQFATRAIANPTIANGTNGASAPFVSKGLSADLDIVTGAVNVKASEVVVSTFAKEFEQHVREEQEMLQAQLATIQAKLEVSSQASASKLIATFNAESAKLEEKRRLVLLERKELEAEKEAMMAIPVDSKDLIDLNVGGTPFTVTRSTLTYFPGSLLAAMFSGRWEKQLARDTQGRAFLEVNPSCFRILVDYLIEVASGEVIPLPQVPAELQRPWVMMLRKLGFRTLQTCLLPKFSVSDSTIDVRKDGVMAVHTGTQGVASKALAPLMLVPSGVLCWKIRILTSRLEWAFIGITTNPNPASPAQNDPSCYGYDAVGNVYSAGEVVEEWPGLRDPVKSEVVFLKLDIPNQTLSMAVSSTSKYVHSMPIKAGEGPFYALTMTCWAKDEVEFLPTNDAEVATAFGIFQ